MTGYERSNSRDIYKDKDDDDDDVGNTDNDDKEGQDKTRWQHRRLADSIRAAIALASLFMRLVVRLGWAQWALRP